MCCTVVASEKGVVVGRIKFHESGDPIDCTRMGVAGKAIPPFIDRITRIEVPGLRWVIDPRILFLRETAWRERE